MSASVVLASTQISDLIRSFIDAGPVGDAYAPTDSPALLNRGDRVLLPSGEIYGFIGDPRGPPPGGLAAEDFTSSDWRQINLVAAGGSVTVTATDAAEIAASTTLYAEVSPTNDGGTGILNRWAGLVLDSYDYINRSGTQTLSFGDRVRVADDHPDADVAGKVFQWMGTTQSVNLGSSDYADFELWKELTPNTLITDSLSYALLSEAGVLLKREGLTGESNSYYGLIDHNDVRSTVEAFIDAMTIVAGADVVVSATDVALISATDDSYVVPWEGVGGVIATNVVLSNADAWLRRSPIEAGGSVSVTAEHLAQIDASATTRIEAWDAKSLVVAFNAIGWVPVNIFFSAADTLTSASDYFYDHTSNDEPAELATNDTVRVDGGAFAGQVFRYLGPTLTGPVDLTPQFQDYGDASTWQNVTVTVSAVFDHTSDDSPTTLDAGDRVKIPGGTNGLIFKYVGPTLTGPVDLTPVSGQDYDNTNLWVNVTPVFGGQRPSRAEAVVVDSPIAAGGDV
ncbi:MAG TPA: hypothetical protein VGK49_08330, partial [Ilumatobacteraceae bacterium]